MRDLDLSDLWAIRDDRTLSEHAKSAYIMLWLRQPDVYPSIPTLAGDMSVSDRTAQNACRELEQAGLLEITRVRHPTGGNSTNRYRLLSATPGASPAPPGASPAPPSRITCTTPGASPAPEANNLKLNNLKLTSEAKDGLPAGSSRKRLDPTSERPWIVNHVQNAVLAVYGWDQALDLDHDRAVDLWVRFVADRSPADPVAYLSKIFADAESIDVLLSNAPFTEGGTVG